jgi:hypothetical protein
MKTIPSSTFLAFCLAGLVAFATAAQAIEKSADKTPRPIRLQLQVDLPFSLNTFRNDDIAEAFAHRVVTALHEQGFQGRIKYVENGETLADSLPVLAINIFEWRVNRGGGTDCTFSASLKSPRGEKSLGMFSGMSMMTWLRRDWFARADSFEEAASDALSNLKARLDATGLIEPAASAKK